MNDTFWQERLEDLAADQGGGTFDVRDDVARGQGRLLRRRVGVAGSAVLVAAVVLGTGLLLGAGDPVRQGGRPAQPVGSGPTAFATFHEPETTLSPQVTPEPPAATAARSDAAARLRDRVERSFRADGSAFGPWRRSLFALTREVLDPAGTHLDYATDSLQSGTDERGVSLGIKMGWTSPGSAGQGMVQVEISTLGGGDREACAGVGLTCPTTVQVDGATVRVGDGDRGSFVVVHRQPDGERVIVLVDPLFGNNSRTSVGRMGVTKADVYRFVQDDRLDLPR